MSASWQRSNGGGPSQPQYGVEQPFDSDSLVALRSTVAAHSDVLGLEEAQVGDLVLVVHELATNAVRHGGGSGRLRMWTSDGAVFCEVSDVGSGFSYRPPDEHRVPPLGATGGRGLWIVAQLVEQLNVLTGPEGTSATVAMRLP
jgi:anti-sigma regulatory factor (Ser/Thr protein kinase)